MGLKYALLGAGSSAAIQTALLLLEQDDTEMVFGIGRNQLPSAPFSFGISDNPKFRYAKIHLTKQFDEALSMLDEVQPDVIINYAAQGETSVSWKNSWCFFETNCVMLSRLAEELAKRPWLQRFVHVSTTGVYGYTDKPVSENEPLQPTTPYAVTKAAFDQYLQMIQPINGLPVNIMRTTTLYCPGQRLYKLVPRAVIAGLKGEKLPLHGGGMIEKSYIHARDLARAIFLVVKHAPVGRVYNVAPDNPIVLRDMVNIIATKLDLTMDQLCDITEARLLQDGGYWLDCSALKRDTGWEMSIELPEGISSVIAWARDHYAALAESETDYVFSE